MENIEMKYLILFLTFLPNVIRAQSKIFGDGNTTNSSGSSILMLKTTQKIGVGGITSPTSILHLPAGTATANTAPLKIDAGTLLSSVEDGALEYGSSHIYFTIGSTRYQLDQQGGGATIYTGDGTLPGARSVSGSGNSLNLGVGGSRLGLFTVYSNTRAVFNSGIVYGTDATNTDANYTVPANVIISELSDVLTAGRTLTLPTAATNGQTVTLLMRFSAGSNKYSLSSAVTDNATGSTFTTLDWGVTYDFMVDQSLAWRLIRKY